MVGEDSMILPMIATCDAKYFHPSPGFAGEGPGVKALGATTRGIVLAALLGRKEIVKAITADSVR